MAESKIEQRLREVEERLSYINGELKIIIRLMWTNFAAILALIGTVIAQIIFK